jgi:hypothetical protein
VNSLRFEALRDGIEGHELLCQFRDALPNLRGADRDRARALLAGGDGVVTKYHVFAGDAHLLDERRPELLALLDR